jgi:hypothetical protein
MRRGAVALVLGLAMLSCAACTPFFYGGVVVLGPAVADAPAEDGEG